MWIELQAYFAAKNLSIGADNVLHPLLFLSTYYNFVYSNIPFYHFWLLLMLVAWASNGACSVPP
jgi:hypothetical protein